MGIITLFILAVGLSMDAFAVSICKGLALSKVNLKNACIVGLWFGGFQALMPIVGYFLGASFRDMIMAYDHWIAFALLLLIGLNMLKESFEHWKHHKQPSVLPTEHPSGQPSVLPTEHPSGQPSHTHCESQMDSSAANPLGFRTMLTMAVATSIDALAAGLSLAMINQNIWLAAAFIGVVTFVFSAVGVKVGSVFGNKYEAKAELIGGIMLIFIGIKILFEHLTA